MKSADYVLAAINVSKSFGSYRVLRTLSLSFVAKEIVLLLGANGAGKSTLLRLLAGLSRADQGEVLRARETRVGFTSHHHFSYGQLTVRENLELCRKLSGCKADAVDKALERWGLLKFSNKALTELSKGNQAKVSIARALMADPETLLLDEPSSNLDERSTELLTSVIRERAAAHGLVVIATHDLHRLRGIATRVVAMAQGEIVADTGPFAARERIDDVIERYRESNR